jgi:hypothetical protein
LKIFKMRSSQKWIFGSTNPTSSRLRTEQRGVGGFGWQKPQPPR